MNMANAQETDEPEDMMRLYATIADAIDDGTSATVRSLFQEHPEMMPFDVPAFGTWLHYAAAHGTLEIAKLLVELGLDVNAVEPADGLRPLKNAAYEDKPDIARFLLDTGAVMDVSSSIRNPLFGAIVGRSPAVTKLLLERGIDSKVRYNSPTMKNMDAVAFAMMQGEHEIAHMIALWNTNGDELAARRAMEEGQRIAYENTVPVDPNEDYADS